MRNPLYPTLLAIVLLTPCLHSTSAEWISAEAGISFNLPNDPDWQQIPGPRSEAKLTLARSDRKAAIVLITFPRKPNETLNEEFITRWEKGYFKKGHTVKVSGAFFTFKGNPAYRLVDRQTKDDVVTLGVVILWLHGDKTLEIAATKFEADPLQDPVIKAFIDSMKPLPESHTAPTNQLTPN